MKQKYLFKNVTITGLPGCGSTTLMDLLREKLKFDGWVGFSGGEFMRQYAIEKGLYDSSKKIHHDASAYSEDFDRQVDLGIREKLQEQTHWIIESWLSGFMAQQVENVLKILVICSDDSVRVDRIVNRDGVTIEEAKKNIEQRYQTNLTKWQRVYAPEWQEWVVKPGLASKSAAIDFWQPDLYDVVIDTYSTNKDQALAIALDALIKK